MWDVLSITDPQNKENKWDLLLHQSIFQLKYVKRHVQILQKTYEEDQYVVQNLTWSVVHLRSTLSNTLLQNVLTLVPLTATGPEVYVATMTTLISNSYNSLVYTLNHMNSIKLKDRPGGNVEYCCETILVYVECLDISGAFNPKHLGYIICIFEDTSDPRFHIWATHKYKKVIEFVKKFLCVTKTSCKLII